MDGDRTDVDTATDATLAASSTLAKDHSVDEPVGLLSIFDRHQQCQSETGASPIVYAAVQPMEVSTTTGRYTDEQKVQRVEQLTEPGGTRAAEFIGRRVNSLFSSRSLARLFAAAPVDVRVRSQILLEEH